jgi:16S rRNA (adenine1518-N6/adenine1519-N6)-dimethyltransferase
MSKRNKAKNSPLTTHHSPFAKKSFGQNFLVDQNYIDKIIAALNPQKEDTIIEIGPGRGALTERIIEQAGRLIAIELDRDLIPLLHEKFGGYKNFQIIESDVLKVDFTDLLTTQHSALSTIKLVANLPYYISTAILQKLIEQREIFSEMILMFQREVVERITAEPGNSERGFLTVLVETYLDAQKLFDIPPNAFRPAPKVWSSVVRLTPKEMLEIEDEKLFREIISAGFQQKRKTLSNNLKNASENLRERFERNGGLMAILEKSNIQSNRRAETLTLEEWKILAKLMECTSL